MDSAIANASSLISSPSFSNSGIDVNTFPVGMAINPITEKLYVSNIGSNTVSVIDTKAINSRYISDKIKTDEIPIPTATTTTTTPTEGKNDIILKEIG